MKKIKSVLLSLVLLGLAGCKNYTLAVKTEDSALNFKQYEEKIYDLFSDGSFQVTKDGVNYKTGDNEVDVTYFIKKSNYRNLSITFLNNDNKTEKIFLSCYAKYNSKEDLYNFEYLDYFITLYEEFVDCTKVFTSEYLSNFMIKHLMITK